MWIWVGIAALGCFAVTHVRRQLLHVRLELSGAGLVWQLQVRVRWGRWHWSETWSVPATPAAKVMGGTTLDLHEVRGGLVALRWYNRLSAELYDLVTITEAWGQAEVGVEDAASTALLTGWVSAVLGGWLGGRIAVRAATPPDLIVVPHWNQWRFAGNAGGAFRISGADIMTAFARTLWAGFERLGR